MRNSRIISTHISNGSNSEGEYTRNQHDSLDTNISAETPIQSDFQNVSSSRSTTKVQKLAKWAIYNKQTRKSVNNLLEILREDDQSLPKDFRTLCQTPRMSSTRITELGTGKYIHFGLESRIKRFLSLNAVDGESLQIDINIDGVPIANSSSSCLWPILINIVGFRAVLLIGVYFGSNKPADIDNYMTPFVTEFLSMRDSGIVANNKTYNLKIRCVVADLPARAFFLNIKSHTGYKSCHKCKIKGKYLRGRVCFPGVTNRPRTDEEFAAKFDENHHKSSVPLFFESITSFGCVSNVVVDYMHAVLLGVTKRLLLYWTVEKKCSYSLNKEQIMKMSLRIMQIAPQLPNEFSRKPRELIHLPRYKATEFRQFILYTLPVITKDILLPKFYDHFMLFHSAIRILCTPNICIDYNHVAASLLTKFVRDFSKLYNNYNVKFNVHSLLHLSDDVRFINEPLDTFSAFKFENYMQILKKDTKGCFRVLEQIANRSEEKDQIEYFFPNQSTDTSSELMKRKKNGSIIYVVISNTKYSVNAPNNFIYIINENNIFKLTKIISVKKDSVTFEGHIIVHFDPFYEKPIKSDLVGMYNVPGLLLGPLEQKEIYKKNLKKLAHFAVDDINYFFTLIH